MWSNQGQGGNDQQGSYGDQGGGYLNTNMASPSASQERKGRSRAQNIFPVTFAQVLHCEQQDDKFIMDGVELHQVTALGLVRTVKENPTRLDYEIDDMTGPPMDVRQFVDNGDDNTEEERTIPMRENTYVRIYGHVRSFNNKRSIVAFKILPVMDANEITNHILECVHSRLYHIKGPAAAGGGTSAAAGPAAAAAAGTGDNTYSGAHPDQGLNPVQQQVYSVISGCSDEQGVSIAFICERVKGPPQKAIRDAIDFLSGEGHIYSTIDDDHFKSTDGM